MANTTGFSSDQMGEQISKWVTQRVHELATEEMEKARERLKQRIPELAAEIGFTLQSALSHRDMEAVLQIVLKPKIC